MQKHGKKAGAAKGCEAVRSEGVGRFLLPAIVARPRRMRFYFHGGDCGDFGRLLREVFNSALNLLFIIY